MRKITKIEIITRASKLEELKEAFAQNDVVSTIDNEVISEGDK